MEGKAKLNGPDLTQGVELSMVPDGTMLLGHALGEPVLLVRRGDELFAIGAICAHFGVRLSLDTMIRIDGPWELTRINSRENHVGCYVADHFRSRHVGG